MSVIERNFFIPGNVEHPSPKEGFKLARTIQAFGSPFFIAHDTVSKSGHKELKDWITKMGYTEYEVEVNFYNFPHYGFATVNMK